ncbi:MAG: gluconate 2-dehydrogenase subunit 3 family protein [Sphingobacteriia bacterium]|nr:MAG: gluconate 2-dehydrogenase subunit 3 family protein [Sphingobacteriia bacterium]
MDRRHSIKALVLGTVGAGVLVEACSSADKKTVAASADAQLADRMQEEKDQLKTLTEQAEFFTPEEMKTITVLGDIIIPADAVSGSASAAGVPAFIAFIVKDMPSHQTPLRGGLRWLDRHSFTLHQKNFVQCTAAQQLAIVDQIAYPEKAKPEHRAGVAFFNLMRDLVTTGFYTSEIGVKDLGYVGNAPNQWNGVPAEVLAQYKLAYSEKENKECARYDV